MPQGASRFSKQLKISKKLGNIRKLSKKGLNTQGRSSTKVVGGANVPKKCRPPWLADGEILNSE